MPQAKPGTTFAKELPSEKHFDYRNLEKNLHTIHKPENKDTELTETELRIIDLIKRTRLSVDEIAKSLYRGDYTTTKVETDSVSGGYFNTEVYTVGFIRFKQKVQEIANKFRKRK